MRKLFIPTLVLTFLHFFNVHSQTWPADTVHTSINSGNPRYPFPQFKEYSFGKTLAKNNAVGVTHADMEKAMKEGYKIMMHRAIYANRAYNGVKYIKYNPLVVPGNPGGFFCSEGDGYALLAAAYFADKPTFDGLWMWIHDNRLSKVKKYYNCADLRAGYTYAVGMPGWDNDETDAVSATNINSATDGDVDIAMGLLIAYRQWGDNMGINDACGNPISYKTEALNLIKALVDTLYYSTSPTGAQAGSKGYMTGDIGIDGYVKGGNTWAEQTNWRATNPLYPWARSIPDPTQPGPAEQHIDYVAPAYFNEFAKFLAENGGSKWQINQYKRAEASSDWLIGQMYAQGLIASAGWNTVTGATASFRSFSDGEDFRTSWRTILNYVWHGNPDSTWNPTTHQVVSGANTYEYDMGIRHANFMKTPKTPSNASATPFCAKLGASPDPSCPEWKGISQIKQAYTPTGGVLSAYGTNYTVGTAASAAVASEDLDFAADLYRQCEILWDDAEAKSSGMTDEERYIKSTPKYFHDWFRLLGMLTTSGNLQAPKDMVPVANMKVYMSVDKTFAYEGDLVTYTVSYRNYGSVAASGVSITTLVDNNYEFVSATNGGTLSGNGITWTVGGVPGFTSAGGIAPTQGSMKFTVRVKTLASAVISCLTSTVTASNSPSWTSNEYPNNASYTMERNCVDLLKDRVLIIKKTSDKTAMNGGDVVNFKVDFENKSGSNLWLNGGRNGVVLSYANFHPTNGTDFYQFYRLWHTAQEAYINLGNYRVSYFLNDAAAIGTYNATTNPTGWKTFVDNQSDLDKYGYNPTTLPLEQQLKFTYQKMPWGSDANGSWNQRIVTQFANVLSAPSTHIYDKLDSDYLIHKGVKGPGFTRTRFLATPAADLTNRLADDWSYSTTAANSALDGQAQRFFPVSPAYTDFTTKFAPVVVNNYSKDICNPNVANFSKVLVEEFDGFTWRRIAGNGPLPGRETYNVVVVDSIPIELTFNAFTNATTLGVTATYTALASNAKYSGIVKWSVPVMLTGEKGTLSYSVTTKAIVCPSSDKNFVNAAWISSQVDSPDSSAVKLRVSCTPVPPTPPVETSLKKTASKTNAMVGDVVTYTLTFTNKDGSTGQWNGSATTTSEWQAAGSAVLPKLNGSIISFDQNGTGNPSPGSNGYGLEHTKVHGKNGWVESTVDPTNSSQISLFFRHTTGTPGQTNFQGVRVEITPNDGGNNFVSLVVYNNATVLASFNNANNNKLSFGGSPDPIKFRVELIDDKMYIWANDFTGAPLRVISGITNLNAGYTGLFASNSQQTVTAWKGHFDSAFDLVITDPIPTQLTNVTTISDAGTLANGTITWPSVSGPILAGTVVPRTFVATVGTCSDFITNIGKATVYGVTNIQSQNVVTCGSTPPTCVRPTTVIVKDAVLEEGKTVTLTALATPTNTAYVYSWYKLPNTTTPFSSGADRSTIVVSDTGRYVVRVADKDTVNSSCFKFLTEPARVSYLCEKPVIKAFVNGQPLIAPYEIKLCDGESTQLSFAPQKYTFEYDIRSTTMVLANGVTVLAGDSAKFTVASADGGLYALNVYADPENKGKKYCWTKADSIANTLTVTSITKPIAAITTSNLSYCSNFSGLTLTAQFTTGATYQWYKKGALVGSNQNTRANADSGTYTVKISLGTCFAISTPVKVIRLEQPKASVDLTGAPFTYCQGGAGVTLTANNIGTGSTFQWLKEGVAQGTASSSLTYAKATSGSWSVIAQSTNGCADTSSVVSVTTSTGNVSLLISGDTVLCPTETLTLTTDQTSGITWTLPDKTTKTGTQLTITTPIAGYYRANYESGSGCKGVDSVLVSFENVAVEPTVLIKSDKSVYCEKETILLTAETANAVAPSFEWFVNSAKKSSTVATFESDQLKNSDTVKVIVTSNGTCSGTQTAQDTMLLKINPSLQPTLKLKPVATTVCSGEKVTFEIGGVSGQGPVPIYTWYNNGIVAGNGGTLELTVSATAEIYATLASDYACASPSSVNSDTLVVKALTSVEPYVSIEASRTILCSGDKTVVFTIDSLAGTGDAPTYQWLLAGAPIQGETKDTLRINSLNDGDAISLRLTSNSSCRNKDNAVSNIVTVSIVPTETATISIQAIFGGKKCEGDSVNLIATISPTGGKVDWSNGQTGASVYYKDWANGESITATVSNTRTCVTPSSSTSAPVILNGVQKTNPTIDLKVLPDNAPLCPGANTLVAVTNMTGLSYAWETNSGVGTDSTLQVSLISSLSGKVSAFKLGCFPNGIAQVERTFDFQVSEPVKVTMANTTIALCEGKEATVTLSTTGQVSRFDWNVDGDMVTSTVAPFVTLPGLTNGQTVRVTGVPVTNCPVDPLDLFAEALVKADKKPLSGFVGTTPITVCQGADTSLTAQETSNYIFQWLKNGSVINGENTSKLSSATAGQYTLIITNGGCVDTSEATIQNGISIDATADPITFVPGEAVKATVIPNVGGATYKWSPSTLFQQTDIPQTTLFPLETGYIKVEVSLDGCTAIDSVLLTKVDKLFIPNAITPETGDQNAFWDIKGTEAFSELEVRVYNRWGNLVHDQRGYSKPWDGTLNGKPLPTGTYYYVIKHPKFEKPKAGDLTIVR